MKETNVSHKLKKLVIFFIGERLGGKDGTAAALMCADRLSFALFENTDTLEIHVQHMKFANEMKLQRQ